MYKCLKCDFEFKEPKRKNINFENYYNVEKLFKSNHNIDVFICPNCKSSDIEELMICDICQEYFFEDDLTNTDGMINGGIGNLCPQCLEDCDVK